MRKYLEDLLAKFGYRTWGAALRDAYGALYMNKGGTICTAFYLTQPWCLTYRPWWMPRKLWAELWHRELRFKKRITEQCFPSTHYKGWLYHHHFEVFCAMRGNEENFRQGRLQWLHHMIEEYYGK